MMRQAGRYLPEYRAIREDYGFLDMMKTPDLATEITLQPIRRFGMDAAILFSDILVTAEALGSQLHFVEKKGPVIDNPVRTQKDADNLPDVSMLEEAHFVFKAIKQLRPELDALNTPLLGFCGAPFTVASYMVEGGSSPDLMTTKKLIGSDPKVLHTLLDKLTELSIEYLNEQIKCGVHGVQIFDTWASHLSREDFEEFSLPYIKRIVEGLKKPDDVAVAVYSRHSASFAPKIAASMPINIMSLDWQCDLLEMRERIPAHIALQGNLDPLLLYADASVVKERTEAILESMRDHHGFVFNLGHGVTPKTPIDNVKLVIDTVQAFSRNH
jgi:uroporphyrinogen decarboxylase